MEKEVDKKQLRSFGLIVGGIFAIIGIWPMLFHGSPVRSWALILAAILIVPALVFPTILYWPNKGWMFIGHILGTINTKIILSAVFFIVVTPIGVIRSMLGKDPMGRRKAPDVDTYRVARQARPPSHLTKQY